VKNTLKNLALPNQQYFPPSVSDQREQARLRYRFDIVGPLTNEADNGATVPVAFSRLLRFNLGVGGSGYLFSWTPGLSEFYFINPATDVSPHQSEQVNSQPFIHEWHRDLGALLNVAPITDSVLDSMIVTHRNAHFSSDDGNAIGVIRAFSLPALVRTLSAISGRAEDILACVVHHKVDGEAILENAVVYAQTLVSPASASISQTNNSESSPADPPTAIDVQPSAWADEAAVPFLRAFVDWCRSCSFPIPAILRHVEARPQQHSAPPSSDERSDGDVETLPSPSANTEIVATSTSEPSDKGATQRRRRRHGASHNRRRKSHKIPVSTSPSGKVKAKKTKKDKRRRKRPTVIDSVLKEPPRHELTISGSATPGALPVATDLFSADDTNKLEQPEQESGQKNASVGQPSNPSASATEGQDETNDNYGDEVDRVARLVREDIARRLARANKQFVVPITTVRVQCESPCVAARLQCSHFCDVSCFYCQAKPQPVAQKLVRASPQQVDRRSKQEPSASSFYGRELLATLRGEGTAATQWLQSAASSLNRAVSAGESGTSYLQSAGEGSTGTSVSTRTPLPRVTRVGGDVEVFGAAIDLDVDLAATGNPGNLLQVHQATSLACDLDRDASRERYEHTASTFEDATNGTCC